ncbi:MAG: hypothetical protein ACKO8G_05375 [Actinomycetota bacterium]
MVETTRPEIQLVRRALAPGLVAILVAGAVGLAVAGPDAAWSAALGVAVGLANFSLNGLSLAWASTISVTAVHAVALGGVVVRLGAVVGLLFALSGTAWFSPSAFALTVVPGTLLLLAYEARLVARGGLGGTLEVPADPIAARAAAARRAEEVAV